LIGQFANSIQVFGDSATAVNEIMSFSEDDCTKYQKWTALPKQCRQHRNSVGQFPPVVARNEHPSQTHPRQGFGGSLLNQVALGLSK